MQTILQLQQALRDGIQPVIHCGQDGPRLPIPRYLAIVRAAWAHPEARFPRSFRGWWPVDGREIARQFSSYVADCINRRGGLPLRPDMPTARLHRRLRERVTVSCRWCGSDIGPWQPPESRFCEASCRRSFYS